MDYKEIIGYCLLVSFILIAISIYMFKFDSMQNVWLITFLNHLFIFLAFHYVNKIAGKRGSWDTPQGSLFDDHIDSRDVEKGVEIAGSLAGGLGSVLEGIGDIGWSVFSGIGSIISSD
jgi:hypothetical protein